MHTSISESLDPICDSFEAAWQRTPPPLLEDYLLPLGNPNRLKLLVELTLIELERRLAAGEVVRVETAYLHRYPELAGDRKAVLGLILRERELRLRQEPWLANEEY